MSDQAGAPGYAVLAGQSVKREEVASHWGGGAAWVLVWVVVIIIIIAILAALFWNASNFLNSSSSSDDHHRGKENNFNFGWLGGLVVFIVVILFLCWLLGSVGGHRGC